MEINLSDILTEGHKHMSGAKAFVATFFLRLMNSGDIKSLSKNRREDGSIVTNITFSFNGEERDLFPILESFYTQLEANVISKAEEIAEERLGDSLTKFDEFVNEIQDEMRTRIRKKFKGISREDK